MAPERLGVKGVGLGTDLTILIRSDRIGSWITVVVSWNISEVIVVICDAFRSYVCFFLAMFSAFSDDIQCQPCSSTQSIIIELCSFLMPSSSNNISQCLQYS